MLELSLVRSMRDRLLLDTDKYLLSDYPISPENLIIIKQHRQTLRDYMTTVNEEMEEMPEFPKFPF